MEPITCDNVKCGILVCADAWYDTNAYKLAGADIIITAWPVVGDLLRWLGSVVPIQVNCDSL